jgi:glucose/mannose transport system substrate-binding protein
MKHRRMALLALSLMLMAAIVLTGCAENSDGEKKLEIFSWWTNGGEADGLNALYEVFKKKYPDVEIINATVAGGAGSNAKAVLATRMQGGEPPDSFQVHGGAELNDSWVAADKMEPLNDLYESQGWMDKFPKSLIDLVSKDGKIYSVPVNVHRGNVLWYNTKVLADNGLKAPETFEDFFKVADALKAKGITAFAMGTKEGWEATHVFETVLVGTLGAEGYNQLWNGQKKFDSPDVKQALQNFKKMLSYVNEDHAARNWQDAAGLVKDGKAAMFIMGDWAQGYYTSVGLKPNVEYGYVPAPGNKGTFMVVTDTFGLPKGVKHREQALNFLSVLGSVEGQDAFNPKKGSIPARIDAGNGNYDVYLKDQMAEFKSNKLTPSLAHGSAAKEGFLTEANKNVSLFVTQQDVDKTSSALQRAAEAHLK